MKRALLAAAGWPPVLVGTAGVGVVSASPPAASIGATGAHVDDFQLTDTTPDGAAPLLLTGTRRRSW